MKQESKQLVNSHLPDQPLPLKSGMPGQNIVISRNWLRMASFHDEDWLQDDLAFNPETVINDLKGHPQKPDIFTFAEKLPQTAPRFKYAQALENLAVVPISTYQDWWENRIPQETRKNVRRAAKRGVVVRVEQFNDEMVRGIKAIYDETPIRQGRRFWHYGKHFDLVKTENSTYLERCEYLCAYSHDELIGFLRMVYTGVSSFILQITSKNAHRDKRPMNALIAKAVEVCVERNISYLIYGQYTYGNNIQSPLMEFKRRNGFEQIFLPRYYIPLTLKGSLAVRLNLHRGFRRFLPAFVESNLLKARAMFTSNASHEGGSDSVSDQPAMESRSQG